MKSIEEEENVRIVVSSAILYKLFEAKQYSTTQTAACLLRS
jgi:hypothetical protein